MLKPGIVRSLGPATSNHLLAHSETRRFWREWELWIVLSITATIYCARLTAMPICGEESRWATVASEMIASGDWIVPRQQGQVFAERPPLGNWAMALIGIARGQVDLVAVRLPSALATTILAGVIYLYARLFLTRFGALSAALVYATLGQVLQIGRLGESEALFTLFLASSLLVWHAGYVRAWPKLFTWCAGYTLAALAALIKGPQAPAYFMAVTGAWLLWKRDWRWLLSWQNVIGMATFASIVAAWQIPFFMATDRQTVVDVWSGLARDRLSIAGLMSHVVSYPFETFGCLLPWAPLLLVYFDPRFRRELGPYREVIAFCALALAITYPTVLLSAGARGRYYMPLYPCFAVLIGIVIERTTAADAQASLRRGWRWYSSTIASVTLLAALVILFASATNIGPLAALQQSPVAAGLLAILAMATLVGIWRSFTTATPPRIGWIAVALAVLAGIAYDGLVINVRMRRMNDIGPEVAAIRSQLTKADELVSLGPVAHRFAYYFGEPIRELSWPVQADELPADLEYFCFERHAGDTDEVRKNGRGRVYSTTPGTLPFQWEEVAYVPCDSHRRKNPTNAVVVGRIVSRTSATNTSPKR